MKRNISIVFGLFASAKIDLGGNINVRQSEPCWCPPFHQKSWPLILQRGHEYFRKPLFILSIKTKIQGNLHTGVSPLADVALCNLLFKTSAGAQTVVATVPAANDAAIWTGTPSESLSILFVRSWRFADVYLSFN